MQIRNLSLEELEERAIDEDLEAIKELVRRYREGDGVEENAEIAGYWSAQLGEKAEASGSTSITAAAEEPETVLSWEERYHAKKRCIIGDLREEAAKGDPTALIVLAEKYLGSADQLEIGEGFKMLDEAENILRKELSGSGASAAKEALVYLFNTKGEELEERYRQTEDDTLPGKIFDAYSNASELDPTQTDGIARCYRLGIGVEKNEIKARAYEDRNSLQGGIEERYKIGREAFDSLETMRATEWFQNALISEDADDHIGLKRCVRLFLGRLEAADEHGNLIDEDNELKELHRMAKEEKDPEAAYYLASLTQGEDEKLCIYEWGASGTPGQYASLCAEKAESITRQREEQERLRQEEQAKLEAEQERLRQEEQAWLEAERIKREERQRREAAIKQRIEEERQRQKEAQKRLEEGAFAQLRMDAAQGDTSAMIALAESYLSSDNFAEINEGIKLLADAENVLRGELSGEGAAIARETLVRLFVMKGESLERIYQSTGEEMLPGMIFNAYSNANELDPTQMAGLARCYKQGIGVEQNKQRARAYEEKIALQGGMEERYRVGREAYDTYETMRATEWFQSALLSEDADEHIGLKHCVRMFLGRLEATDGQGNSVDEEYEHNELYRMAKEEKDPEASYYLASLTQDEDEKLRCYDWGASGTPGRYASLCAQNAENIRWQREERERLRREEEARLEEELRRRKEEKEEARKEERRRKYGWIFEERTNKILVVISWILIVCMQPLIAAVLAGIAIKLGYKGNAAIFALGASILLMIILLIGSFIFKIFSFF